MTHAAHDGMVWVIGLNRTGTTSLAHALYILGYPNLHYPDAWHMLRGDHSIFEGWKGGSDLSVAACYRALDEAFPGSRFVLSLRDRDRWLSSVTEHFARMPEANDAGSSGDIRRLVYGTARPSADGFAQAYERHLREVRAYFNGRDDLLEMRPCDGEGWELLCPFLGVPTPSAPFPNTNRADGLDRDGSHDAVEMHRQVAARDVRAARERAGA